MFKRWAAELIWLATPPCERSILPPGAYESPLDKLGNSVVDAIEAGDFDKAEKLCRRLLREYPGAVDGHDRLALLREAQGRFREAAEHYEKVLEMVRRSPKRTDPEIVSLITAQRDLALARIARKDIEALADKQPRRLADMALKLQQRVQAIEASLAQKIADNQRRPSSEG
jgi:tetratricopeptide (TPR) repeat protein